MILDYGNTIVSVDWAVTEPMPVGYARVYYVHGGDVTYYDSSTSKKLKEGFLYIMPTSSPYQMIQNIHNRLCCTYMHINFNLMLSRELIEIEVCPDSFLYYLIGSLKSAIKLNDDYLVRRVSETFEAYCRSNNFLDSPPVKMSEAIELMSSSYNTDISISEISATIGYQEQYFIRLFKKHIGMSPYSFIMELRFKEAIRLLMQNNKVCEVAIMVGYKDTKTFSRAFKTRYGRSPKEIKHHTIIV